LAGRAPLHDSLPPGAASSDELLGRFLDYVAGKGLSLYPARKKPSSRCSRARTSS
jgi:hypothetical protein